MLPFALCSDIQNLLVSASAIRHCAQSVEVKYSLLLVKLNVKNMSHAYAIHVMRAGVYINLKYLYIRDMRIERAPLS
jgi:hypothetical protein